MFKVGCALYYSMAQLGLWNWDLGIGIVQSAPTLNIYTGFNPSQLMTNTSGCCYSL